MIRRGKNGRLRKLITTSLVAAAVATGGTIASSTGAQAITAGTDLNWSTIGKDFVYAGPQTTVVDTTMGLNGISGQLDPNQTYGVDVASLISPRSQGLALRVEIVPSAAGSLDFWTGSTHSTVSWTVGTYYQQMVYVNGPGSLLSFRSTAAATAIVDVVGTFATGSSAPFVPLSGTLATVSASPVTKNLAGVSGLPQDMSTVGAIAVKVSSTARATTPLRGWAADSDEPTGDALLPGGVNVGQALIQPSTSGDITFTCSCGGFRSNLTYTLTVQGYFPITEANIDLSYGSIDGSNGIGVDSPTVSAALQERLSQAQANAGVATSAQLGIADSPLGHPSGSGLSDGGTVLDGTGPDSYAPESQPPPSGTWIYDKGLTGRSQGTDQTACGPAATATILTSWPTIGPKPSVAEVKAYEGTGKYGTTPWAMQRGINHYIGTSYYGRHFGVSNTALWNKVTYNVRNYGWNIVDPIAVMVRPRAIWYPSSNFFRAHWLVIYGFSNNYKGKAVYLVWDPEPVSVGGGVHSLAKQDWERVAYTGKITVETVN